MMTLKNVLMITGSLWRTTPYLFLRLASSKKSLDVSSVSRVIHSHAVFPCRCIIAWRSYRTSSTEEIPLYKSKSAYYDILQVSSNATQAQIKTAYYKQSFIYHPDKNADSEHAMSRFSQISEAYSVLGNRALRKKYDSGILGEADIRGPSRPTVAKETMSGFSGDATRSLWKLALVRRTSLISTHFTASTTASSCSDRNTSELVCKRSRSREKPRYRTGSWDACQK